MKSKTKLTLLVLSTVTTAVTLQIANATPAYRVHQPACFIETSSTIARIETVDLAAQSSETEALQNPDCPRPTYK